jgi:hypothetical protein
MGFLRRWPLQRAPQNWLVVLFQINLRGDVLGPAPLHFIYPHDAVLLLLVGATFLPRWRVLAKVSRVWTLIAVAMPPAGIVLLEVTKLAGRCSLMGAGLVVGFLMLKGANHRFLACLGILANALLLAGDLATGGRVPAVGGVVATGYVLVTVWYLLIAAQDRRDTSDTGSCCAPR